MSFCDKCGANNDEVSSFCQNCGATIGATMPEALPPKGFMSKIEQSVYFRIARGSAWIFLILAVIALAGTIIYLFPTATKLIGGETSVSKDEIIKAIEAEKVRKPFMFGDVEKEKFDPELMAKLDREIYEIIQLLPVDIQNQWGIEGLRNQIKNSLGFLRKIKDKISLVQNIKSVIRDFPEAERLNAFSKYTEIKQEKENELQQKKTNAKATLSAMSTLIISLIALITSITMILVLLAIERNTRQTR